MTKYPLAAKRPHILTAHGDQRVDPWFWLNDRKNKEVMQHLRAENAYTEEGLKDLDVKREEIFQELKSRIKETDTSLPNKDGDYDYYHRIEAGKDYPVYCRKKRIEGAQEEIILDAPKLAEGHDFFDLGFVSHSPNHRFLAYAIDTSGDETFRFFIKDLDSGLILKDLIDKAAGLIEWTNDSQGFYYVKLDRNQRPKWVFFHRLHTEQKADKKVYTEKEPGFFVSIMKSENDRFIYITSEGNNSSEYYYFPADKELNPCIPQIIFPRENECEYDVSDHGDFFYILTNKDAMDYRIIRTPIASASWHNVQNVIEHKEGELIEDFTIFKDYMVVEKLVRGACQFLLYFFASEKIEQLIFSEPTSYASLGSNWQFDATKFRYSISSLKTPTRVYEYDVRTRTHDLLKSQEIPDKSFASENFVTEFKYVKGHDGEEIPVSLLYHKNTPLDGSARLFLYGYGAYGLNVENSFSLSNISLVERGVIFACVHVRGGMDKGRKWYLDGKLMAKKNTFYDVISCAEFLIEKSYTSKGNIVLSGGSAGGLLVGAVLNMRPELFGKALAHVPFVDVLTTMLDDTLTLTPLEYNEWGNPQEKEVYDYIKSYSPYDNVTEKEYPEMLVVCGLNDQRVTYWEPVKWVQKLRTNMSNKDRKIFCLIQMDAGHSGATGRYDSLKEEALDISYILA